MDLDTLSKETVQWFLNHPEDFSMVTLHRDVLSGWGERFNIPEGERASYYMHVSLHFTHHPSLLEPLSRIHQYA